MHPAQAIVRPGAWHLERNPVWNPPDGVAQAHFEYPSLHKDFKPRGPVVDFLGRIYGLRTLQNPSQDGYCLFGRVSVRGKKVNAFTGSQLFEREDGSLVDVAVIRIAALPPWEDAIELLRAASKC